MKSCGEYIIQQGGTIYSPVPSGMSNFCNGRLTLTSGAPVLTTDVTAATTIYFTPYNGNIISLYDTTSTTWHSITFSELSLSIAGYTANTNYDVFGYLSSGVLALSTTPWANDTTRVTALTTQDGVLVKTGAVNYRYLGSFRTKDSEIKAQYNQSNKDLDELVFATFPYQGQAFNLASGATLTGASFYLSKLGSPTGNAYFRLYACTGTPGSSGAPTGTLLATTAAIDVSTLSSSYTMLRVNFTTPYVATSGNYCLYVDYTGGDTSNGVNSGWGTATKTGNSFSWTGSSWYVNTTYNACFYLWGYSTATTEVSFGVTPASGGSAPKCFVSNYCNKIRHSFSILDSTDSWTWNTNTWRQKNNNASNQFAFISGVKSSTIIADNISFGYGSSQLYSGIGYDVTSALAAGCVSYVGGYNAHVVAMSSKFTCIPSIGYHFLAPLENSYAAGTYLGDGGDSSLFQSGVIVQWEY